MRRKVRYAISAALAALLGLAALLLLRETRKERALLACEHVEVEFRDSLKFVSAKEITSWLDRNYGVCTGQRLDSLDLQRIENMLLSRGPIVGCEAWTDDHGVLHIEIRQREPVLRFSYGDTGGYYVDADGYIFPLHRSYTADVRVIEGSIPVRPAAGFSGQPESDSDREWIAGMLEFERRVSASRTWDDIISRTIIRDNGDIALTLGSGDELYIIGDPDRLDEKFSGIARYQREIRPEVGDGYYRTVNLKYKNQIICRQKDT